jgi:hypothetical protein
MTDPLLKLAELLGAVAERLVTIELRLIEAIVSLDARLKRGGERAGKAERATADALARLATAEAVEALRGGEEARHAEMMAAIGRLESRLGAVEARPAPATWADLFGKHPALVTGLGAVLLAIAAYLGSLAPRRADEPPPEPTAVLPGAGSRLMNDRRLADGSEG